MTRNSDKGVEHLLIDQVNMRGLFVKINDGIELEDFGNEHLNNTQILKGFDRVKELVLETDESDANESNGRPFIYKYYITLGIRSLSDEDALKEADDESIEPLLEIRVNYAVQYASTCSLDQADCLAFAKGHVYFHAWPYFREVVQSSCARLSIEPLPIPPYRVPKEA